MGLITSQEIKKNTSMGGNVDADKFMHLLIDVQILILEPVLGTALYDKLVLDFESDTLTGDYLEMFTGYVKPILWHSVYAQYLRDGIILAQNTGIYENAPENASGAELENIKYVSKSAQSKADVYISRLERYLCDKNLPEYVNNQPNEFDLDPRDVNTIGGWHLGRVTLGHPYSEVNGNKRNGYYLE